MAQKAYSKHSEYRTYSTKGTYDDGDFDSMKAELLPSKYGSLVQPANGAPGNKEYFYEYKEERDPGKNYDRKDLHTVEQYEFSHSPSNVSVTPRPLPAITSSSHQHSYSRKGDLSQNIEELDSLLDDLQRDQERKPYKSGYSSDTMESSSFDYRSSNTPVKSSGYSSLSKVEREEWLPAPAPVPATLSREVNREVIRKQVTESRMVPAGQTGAAVCDKCHPPLAAGGPMNKVTTTVKTYTYEVPADQDPSLLPIPGSQQLLSSDRSYLREDHTHLNTSTPVGSPVRHSPLPSSHYRETTTSVTGAAHSSSGHPGHVCPHTGHSCPHAAPAVPHPTCPHCSLKITAVQGCPDCPPHVCPGRDVTLSSHYSTTLEGRGAPASPLYAVPVDLNRQPPHGGPPGSAVHKYSSSNYSYSSNSTGPHSHPHPQPAPSPFPLPGEPRASPGPRTLQEPPKKLDDLLADFPGHESIPPGSGELRQRPNPARGPGGAINGIEQQQQQQKAVTLSKNIAGPAVYYPPGHENFSGKGEAAAYQQAGGGYKAKGSYKYEAEASSKSKSKSSSGGAVVPVCLPLCCAMPCVLL